ncbi:MAG: hypothetical protein ABI045_07480 [Flavobacteriales bacterium]
MISKTNIRSLSVEALRSFLTSIGENVFRTQQIYDWRWHKGIDEVKAIYNLPKRLREQLGAFFSLHTVQPNYHHQSIDGRIKYAMRLYDGNLIESVLIPTEKQSTAYISSQIGYSLGCKFCAKAQLPRMRNLQFGKIYDQVRLLDRYSREQFGRPLNNVVFMGMSEPFFNYPNVIQAIKKITTAKGYIFRHGASIYRPHISRKLSEDLPMINRSSNSPCLCTRP